VVQAAKAGAPLARNLDTKGKSAREIVADPAFQWTPDGQQGDTGQLSEGTSGPTGGGTPSARSTFITTLIFEKQGAMQVDRLPVKSLQMSGGLGGGRLGGGRPGGGMLSVRIALTDQTMPLSRAFMRAMPENERVSSLVLQVYSMGAEKGEEAMSLTVKISNARIANVHLSFPTRGQDKSERGGGDLDVDFVYEAIQIAHEGGKNNHADDWNDTK
jgi:hypothetical protein